MFCFSFRNFHLRLWFGSWEGAPVPRAVSDSVQDPEFLAFVSWLPHGEDSVQNLIVPTDAFWGH